MKTTISYLKPYINAAIIVLILELIAVIVPVLLLGSAFDFPDILRKPAAVVFEKFKSSEALIVAGYYVFLISSLLYILLSYSLQKVLYRSKSQVAKHALVGFGIATAIFQCIGFIRWIFVMPFLTHYYFESPKNQQIAIALYEILNRFAGMSIGEYLGFIAMGLWTIALGIILIKHPKLNNWVGYLGMFIGLLLLFSTLENFGGQFSSVFGFVNFIANSLWSIWLLLIAISINKLKTE